MGIEIPKRLNDHLLKDNHWYGCVTSAKSKIEYFLSESPLFFPDYTGHGIEHINQVLIAADKLIRDDAFRPSVDKDESSGILEPMDLAYLICAIMIHDMGMFLKKDGAEKVINSACGRPIPRIGDDSWKNLWQDYFDSTHRSTQSAMRRQFGKFKGYSEDCFAMDNMGEDERRFIGEFLRRHHGRLSHEIALRGLPGSTTIDIFDGCGLSNSDRDMIGILARSHTMSIRDTESYLKTSFEEGSMPENTPVFFLMSVLRIADLLDAGNHRAPELLLAHQRIYVPASEEEWAWNQRIIQHKCKWNLKSKNRSIYAEPKCSVEYVLLDKWLKWVQSELDLCWSILAERYPDGYRLTIHRVTSRIHQPEYYKKMNETFLPREVTVSANPEITQLLIAPLYGNDPSFGVRELLQNAVDACEERRYRELGYKGQVTVRIDPWADPVTGENRGVFTIEDNGVGMNEHVLLNYYLSAGSSYRSSEEWKKEYTEGGRSMVARTGKFGIGFLAAFLLGDEIEVHTQHVNDNLGYKFSFTNEAKPLNVQRAEREEPGTTVRIILKNGVRDRLRKAFAHEHNQIVLLKPPSLWMEWYAFDEPRVQYFFDDFPVPYKGEKLFRDPAKNAGWFHLDSTGFDKFIWSPNYTGETFFLCNGIHIHQIARTTDCYGFPANLYGFPASLPKISVIDSAKLLDVTLSRNHVQTIPAEKQLYQQLFRYHITRLLMTSKDAIYQYSYRKRSGFFRKDILFERSTSFILTEDSFQLDIDAVYSVLDLDQFILLIGDYEHREQATASICHFLSANFPHSIHFEQNIPSLNQLFALNGVRLSDFTNISNAHSHCGKIWAHQEFFHIAEALHAIEESSCETPLSNLQQNQHFYSVPPAENSVSPVEVPINWDNYDSALFPFAIQVLHPNTGSDTLFVEVLREVLEPAPGYDRNDIWIPFDMEERRKKFPKAFQELKVYIDAIERDPEAHHVNI